MLDNPKVRCHYQRIPTSQSPNCLHLRQLFQRLADYGLVVNPYKCVFRQLQLDLFGHRATHAGIKPLQDRVHVIQQRRSRNTWGYCIFIDDLCFMLRKCCCHLISEIVELKDETRSSTWTHIHTEHFRHYKDALTAATHFAQPSPTAQTNINTVASHTAVGAVLQPGGMLTRISFFCR